MTPAAGAPRPALDPARARRLAILAIYKAQIAAGILPKLLPPRSPPISLDPFSFFDRPR
jgi:hypothetical protein